MAATTPAAIADLFYAHGKAEDNKQSDVVVVEQDTKPTMVDCSINDMQKILAKFKEGDKLCATRVHFSEQHKGAALLMVMEENNEYEHRLEYRKVKKLPYMLWKSIGQIGKCRAQDFGLSPSPNNFIVQVTPLWLRRVYWDSPMCI
jgi:hypothetical protein